MNEKINTIFWKKLYNHLIKNCFTEDKDINVYVISSIEIHASEIWKIK